MRLEASNEAVYLSVTDTVCYRVNGNHVTGAPSHPFDHRGLRGIAEYPRYARRGPRMKADLQRKIEEAVVRAKLEGHCSAEEAEEFLAEVFQ